MKRNHTLITLAMFTALGATRGNGTPFTTKTIVLFESLGL